MDINSLHGVNAYNSTTPNTSPQIDNAQLREANLEASRSDVDAQTTAAVAFEVSITQEAQDRLAAENNQQTQEAQATTQAAAPQENSNEPVAPAQDASQIVNIVA